MVRDGLGKEIKQTRPFALPEVEAYLNLLRTGDALSARIEALMKEHGLTQQQYNVLRILRGSGPEGLPILEVAARMVTRVPDITRLLDRMEQKELVARHRCEKDRRVVYARITTKGRRLATRLEGPADELHREQLGHLNKAELTQLNRLLVKVRRGE